MQLTSASKLDIAPAINAEIISPVIPIGISVAIKYGKISSLLIPDGKSPAFI